MEWWGGGPVPSSEACPPCDADMVQATLQAAHLPHHTRKSLSYHATQQHLHPKLQHESVQQHLAACVPLCFFYIQVGARPLLAQVLPPSSLRIQRCSHMPSFSHLT